MENILVSFPLLNLGVVWTVSSLSAQQGTETDLFRGRRLNDWVAQAMAEGGPTDLAATVEALSQAVQSNDPNVKRKAADALAVLGPKAKAALPALLDPVRT